MTRFRALATAASCAVAFAGCTSTPEKTVEPEPTTITVTVPVPVHVPVEVPVMDAAAVELDSALRYFNELRKMSAAAFRREHETASKAFAREPSDLNRVRLALACSLPSASNKDDKRALELLEPMTKDARTPLRSFALVLHAFVAEQNKSAGNAQALKEKLDALKSLEKSLSERERLSSGGTK